MINVSPNKISNNLINLNIKKYKFIIDINSYKNEHTRNPNSKTSN